jgi:hypothetical protein
MPSHYEAIDGSLFIDSVRPENAGRYSCVGTNRQGQVVFSSDAVLEVSGSKINFSIFTRDSAFDSNYISLCFLGR